MLQSSETSVEAFEAIAKGRRSVRGFLPTPVEEDKLKAIFDLARWAPSGTNVQPWHSYVASGPVCEQLRQGFLDRVDNGVKPNIDHAPDGKAGAPWRDRKRACAKVLYDAMSIEWEDREGRGRAARRNFEFFDAPHAVFLGVNEVFGLQTACDVGMYAQTLMLAMQAHGVSSCAQGTLRNYPDFVREVFGIEPEIKILFGISFGYEDTSVPANAARTDRAPLSENVVFLG